MVAAYTLAGISNVILAPILANNPPTANLRADVGQEYLDRSTTPPTLYFFNGQTWVTPTITGAPGVFTNLTANGAVALNTVGAGVTSIGTGGTGATNIGNTTGNTAVAGNLVVSGSITSTLGNITATNGNLVLGTAGNKLVSTSVATTTAAGANSFGTVTLVGGTATVATTAITTNSIVFLTRQTIGATGAAILGFISRGTIVNGVSFVINSLSQTDATALQASDVSNIGWMIVN